MGRVSLDRLIEMSRRHRRAGALGLAGLVALLSVAPASAEPRPDPAGPDLVRYGEPAQTFAAGFIKVSLPEEGFVLEASGNKRMYASGDRLSIKLVNPQEVQPGSFYTIYRWVHEVLHPWTKRYVGNLYTMVAVVKVVEIEQDVATVAIERTYDSISPRYAVMRFEVPPAEPRDSADRSGPPGLGTIVDLPPQQTMAGKGTIVYLDWGRREGLRTGDRLEVIRLPVGRPRVPIGLLKVAHVEEGTATAFIIQSSDAIQRGDRVAFKEPAPPPEPPPREATASGLGQARPTTVGRDAPALGESAPEAAGVPDGALADQVATLARRLEFPPGRVLPTGPGLKILDRIADLLRNAGEPRIRIEGHADDQPIGASLLGVFPSNRELSVARAEAVARYFAEHGGLDPANLSTAGFGETKPVADNRTEDGRRRNRRIEVRFLPAPASRPAPITENP